MATASAMACRLHPGGPGVSDISSAGMAGVAPGYVTRREGERRFLPGLKTGVSTPQN